MSTKKDLDNILKNNAKSKKSPAKKQSSGTSKSRTKNDVDNMSVDDVVNSLGDRKSAGIKSDTPKKLAPLAPKKSTTSTKPASENKSKKKIVITGELPDYDALRKQELDKEKQKKAEEEAERKRLEAEKKAKEEAERKRLEAEKKAKEEAERKRLEAEKKAKEETERKRLEAEKKAREEAERKRLEAEKKAREEAERKRLEAEKKAKEEAERKRLEAEKKAREEAERKRLEAEETKRRLLEEAEEFTVEEITEISTSEEYDDDYDEYEEFNVFNNSDEESDPVGSLIDNIREDAEKAFADIENSSNDDTFDDEDEEYDDDYEDDVTADEPEKTSKGISSTLENILDEDVDEIINERSEKAESDRTRKPKLRLKKNIYAFFGVLFAVLACVGLVTIVSKGVSLIGGFSSGNSKKSGFEPVVYPVVIMDIESFETPAELSSEQVITAAIWSMIMSDDAIGNYEQTFDVVKIPAVDVESYAVKLFGENLPALNHTTVGPAESRFYYNEETKSYNVPIAPVTYTYSPEIKGATKHDSTYTIVVDYIDELPEWLPKKSSKSVEFKLTETNDGYTIDSMKVLSTSRNSL